MSLITNDLSQPFQPSDLTAFERYEAIQPILGEATAQYLRLIREEASPDRDADVATRLNKLFEQAAQGTKMSTEEARRAFQGYNTMGMSGLMAPIPLSAALCAETFEGTWELRHRFTNGGRTPHAGLGGDTNARSNMYYDVTNYDTNEVDQLTVMWTEENHYIREEAVKAFFANRDVSEQTFLIAALNRIKLNQIDEYTVEYLDEGEYIGNYSDFQNGGKAKSRALMMRFGGSESLLGIPETKVILDDGSEQPVTGTFLLLNSTGCGPTAFSWIMSGLPPMHGDEMRSFDTVDTYIKQNADKPLIGGFETLETYFNRLRNPGQFAETAVEMSRKNRGNEIHGFYPLSLETLRRYRRDYRREPREAPEI